MCGNSIQKNEGLHAVFFSGKGSGQFDTILERCKLLASELRDLGVSQPIREGCSGRLITSPKAPLPSRMGLPDLSSSNLSSRGEESPSCRRAPLENLVGTGFLLWNNQMVMLMAASKTTAAPAPTLEPMMTAKFLPEPTSAWLQINLFQRNSCPGSRWQIHHMTCNYI